MSDYTIIIDEEDLETHIDDDELMKVIQEKGLVDDILRLAYEYISAYISENEIESDALVEATRRVLGAHDIEVDF